MAISETSEMSDFWVGEMAHQFRAYIALAGDHILVFNIHDHWPTTALTPTPDTDTHAHNLKDKNF